MTMREAIWQMNLLFMEKFPDDVIYEIDYEKGKKDVLNIPNRYLMRWFGYYGFYHITQERSCRNINNFKTMYALCDSEYASDECRIVIEIKSRRCKKTDKYARQNYIWDDWHQYGYIVWREKRDGSYKKEFQTHYEHVLMEYLLCKCNLKKYAD